MIRVIDYLNQFFGGIGGEEAGEDLETRALEALINAEPNTIIKLPAGSYDFSGELSVSVDPSLAADGNLLSLFGGR